MRAFPSSPAQSTHTLVALELIRFVCAISVLVWHYQHFYFVKGAAVSFVLSEQPLYVWLKPFYEAGWLGVQVFWCLSGFIFFWKYAQPIAEQQVSVRRFVVWRFSRLYPLHIGTLFAVLVLALWYRSREGGDFVYQFNDWKHFVLQLFMASDWFGVNQWSFNGPIWSISIEILVYALFFVLSRWGGVHAAHALAVIGTSGLIYALKLTSQPLVLCVFFFYLGGLTLIAYQKLQRVPTGLLLVVKLLGCGWLGLATGALVQGVLPPMFFVALGTPVVLVLALDVIRPHSSRVTRLLTALGNTTYASYLLHFPLQLLTVNVSRTWGVPIPVRHPAMLLSYLAITFGLSVWAYRVWEMPAQAWLRRYLGRGGIGGQKSGFAPN